MLHIKALVLVVSDKKVFYVFPISQCKTCDPWPRMDGPFLATVALFEHT